MGLKEKKFFLATEKFSEIKLGQCCVEPTIWCARGPRFDTLSGHFLSWRSCLPLLQIPRTDSAANIVCDLRATGPGLDTWSLLFLSWRLILPLLLIPRPYSQAGMVSDSRARGQGLDTQLAS